MIVFVSTRIDFKYLEKSIFVLRRENKETTIMLYHDLSILGDYSYILINKKTLLSFLNYLATTYNLKLIIKNSNNLKVCTSEIDCNIRNAADNYFSTKNRDPELRCISNYEYNKFINSLLKFRLQFQYFILEQKCQIGIIAIFNGRLGYSAVASDVAYSHALELKYLEEGIIPGGYFYFSSIQIHDYKKINKFSYIKSNKKNNLKIDAGTDKLVEERQTSFTRSRLKNSLKKYDLVYYLSSGDEYKYLRTNIKLNITLEDKLEYLSRLANKENFTVAVRAHPNMRQLEPTHLNEVRVKCLGFGFDYYESWSRINSLSLLKNGGLCIVDLSSIVIAASRMGFKCFSFLDSLYEGYFSNKIIPIKESGFNFIKEADIIFRPIEFRMAMQNFHVPLESENNLIYPYNIIHFLNDFFYINLWRLRVLFRLLKYSILKNVNKIE